LAIQTETYYRTYGPMVLRRCRFLLRDEELARDAMHDVFVQLLVHEARLDGGAPSSLLYRIATNVCLNKIRSRRHRQEEAGDGLIERIAAAGDEAGRASARSVLRRLFGWSDSDGDGDGARASSAAMAVMHLLDGMSLEEVAGEVGMSVSGVRKRLRGLRAAVVELERLDGLERNDVG
jgi:RNA polymerase sigma-70 factor (ECF subfamily)